MIVLSPHGVGCGGDLGWPAWLGRGAGGTPLPCDPALYWGARLARWAEPATLALWVVSLNTPKTPCFLEHLGKASGGSHGGRGARGIYGARTSFPVFCGASELDGNSSVRMF